MISEVRFPVVARIHRGSFVESEHRGIVAICDASGRLLRHYGDPGVLVGLRSAAKPFQLLPLVESGAADRYGLTAVELAVISGSHSGRSEHVQAVRSVLNKAGIPESQLQCGSHMPFDNETSDRLIKDGQAASPLQNNCSGKHAGLLALAKFLEAPLDSYLSASHPAQRAVRSALSWAAGVRDEAIGISTDGCGAPTFFLPLVSMATAFAKLAAADGSDVRGRALKRIREAMIAHPVMVAGPGRLDTVLMSAVPQACAKGGAEAFQGLAVRPDGSEPLGVAVKVMDGASRALGPVALEVLRQVVGTIPGSLETLRHPAVKNHLGAEVGRIEPTVTLENA